MEIKSHGVWIDCDDVDANNIAENYVCFGFNRFERWKSWRHWLTELMLHGY